jgi:polyvinyl alcohol dehydrogenase (cytochrome)
VAAGTAGWGFLALVVAACGKDATGQKNDDTADAGPPPAWSTQAYDVQSTWHVTNEQKLTKKNIGKLVELWTAPLGLVSTVTAVNGRVYTSASWGIAALDADTGRTLWRQSGTPEQSIGTSAAPTFDNGVLYIDNASNGYVYALDANDGHVIWSKQVETHPRSAGYSVPIVSGDRIFFGVSSNEEENATDHATFKGSVVALEKATGKLAWKTPTAGDDENGCAVWSTVALDPTSKTVFATTGNNYTENAGPGSDSIFAFDMESGAVKWHVQVTQGDVYTVNTPNSPDSDFGANPVVFDYKGRHLVAAGQKSGNIYVFDRDSGNEVTRRALGMGTAYIGGIFQALSWDGRYLYTVNNTSTSTSDFSEDMSDDSMSPSVLFALEPLSLDIVWERQLPAWVWSPMTLVNDMGLLGAEKHLEAFDTANGKKLFDFQTNGSIVGAPVVNDGRIYVASGLTYFFGHSDDKLHALGLPDDPAVGKHYDAGKGPDLSAPTFGNVYAGVIAKSCIDAQCHGSSMQGNLSMINEVVAYSNLVGMTASGKCAGPDGGALTTCGCAKSGKVRVVPGKPDESLLVEKLAGNPTCGDRMPPTTDPLSDDLQNLVKTWIKNGATLD